MGPQEAMVCEEQAVEGTAEVSSSPFRACEPQQPTVVLAAGRSRTLACCLPGLAWTLVVVLRVGCQPLVRLRGQACVQEGPEPSWLVHHFLCCCCSGVPDSATLTCPRAQSHWQELVASCREMFSSTLESPSCLSMTTWVRQARVVPGLRAGLRERAGFSASPALPPDLRVEGQSLCPSRRE